MCFSKACSKKYSYLNPLCERVSWPTHSTGGQSAAFISNHLLSSLTPTPIHHLHLRHGQPGGLQTGHRGLQDASSTQMSQILVWYHAGMLERQAGGPAGLQERQDTAREKLLGAGVTTRGRLWARHRAENFSLKPLDLKRLLEMLDLLHFSFVVLIFYRWSDNLQS